jgi:hypothetical protein
LQRTSLLTILPDQKLGVVVLTNSLEAEESVTPIETTNMKPFVAVVVLQPVDEGLFALDDPLPAV